MNQCAQSPHGNDAGTSVQDACPIPPCFKELAEFDAASADRRLGYFGSERFVIFSFHPTAAEVIWKDGRSSGFGGGGWRMFLDVCVPLAERHGARLGTLDNTGIDVLLLDRTNGKLYAAPRAGAEAFLARVHGKPPPTRRCICGMMPLGPTDLCNACPFKRP